MHTAFARFQIVLATALFLFCFCAYAEPPSTTLPVRTVFTAPAVTSGQLAPPKPAPNDTAVKTRKPGNGKKASLLPGSVEKRFSADPFGMTHRAKNKDTRHKPLRYTPQETASAGVGNSTEEQGVTFRAGSHDPAPKSRLAPSRAVVFSGGEHTKPYLDSEQNAPEVEMRYKKKNDPVTTRVVVNPQDPASPLYRPATKENAVNAAGVYMDIDLDPDMQMQVGGEVGSVERKAAEEKAASGASVGLKLQF